MFFPVHNLISFLLSAAVVFSGLSIGLAQSTPDDVKLYQAQYNKILEDSGRHFYQGLEAFKLNKRSASGEQFDKAVEVFLYSSLSIQRDQKLQTCFSQVIESIYRIEYPNYAQPPQLRQLSTTCGWKWGELQVRLADEVAQLSRISTRRPTNESIAARTTESIIPNANFTGFTPQGFEPSPLDELSRLELNSEELDVATNSASQQYQYLQYAKPIRSSLVRAQAGDTVSKLARRHGADPIEVARYNGLLPNSTLSSGREIRIPSESGTAASTIATQQYSRPTNCSALKAPVVQKLRLGLSTNEVADMIGRKLSLRLNPYSVEPTYYAAFRGTKGVRQMYLGFFKGRLFRISVDYDDSIKWTGLNEFQEAVARSFGFPTNWQNERDDTRRISCDEFEVTTEKNILNYYSLTLSDPQSYRQMYLAYSERLRKFKKDQELKRKTFKP